MNEDRRQILQMLAEQKITTDEAERLLSALEAPAQGVARSEPSPARAKYLRVMVDAEDAHRGGAQVKVNVRVPMQLLRAGAGISAPSLMPAREQVNAAMREQGIPFDLGQMKPADLEDMIEHLNDLTVDVDQEKTKVRVFCE